jgi:hypothetical protein
MTGRHAQRPPEGAAERSPRSSGRDREAERRDELATIDELLLAAEEPAQPGRSPSLATSLLANAGFAFVVAGMIYVVLRAGGYSIPFLLLFAVIFSAMLLRRALAMAAPKPLPPAAAGTLPAAPEDPEAVALDQADGLYVAMSRWDTRLEWTERDPGRFARVVRARLADVADERLRQRHGITRAGDPVQARALMGELLWAFLHVPITRNPTPGEMAAIVAKVEAL